MQDATNKMLKRIQSHGRGWVFTPAHFEDLAGRSTVGTVLQRLHEKGTIRQLARGLYHYPKLDPQLGLLEPDTDAIARALAGRDAIRLQASGAYAANLLGLSTQVPMKRVFLTDGLSRTVQVGRRQIVLRRTTPKNMATAGRISGLVIQALRHIGQEQVDAAVLRKLNQRLDDDARQQLLKDSRYAPEWIARILRQLLDRSRNAELGTRNER